jgi:hypothetical protein
MRNKISFGSFFDISSSELVVLFPVVIDELILLNAAVLVNVATAEPLRVVIN